MNVLVVDDEPLAREGIRRELEKLPHIRRVDACARREDAVAAILERRPDVALLDIQLGRATAFDIIEEIGVDAMPLVIFVTAYDRHALKAFEVHALDYVLKPIDPDRLREAIDRAASMLSLMQHASMGDRLELLMGQFRATPGDAAVSRSPDRLTARDGEHLVFVDPSRIDWISGAGNYVKLHCGVREYVMRSTMDGIQARLAATGDFIRVRRSALINIAAITRLERYAKGMYVVLLRSGHKVISSRYHQNGIRKLVRPR